MNCSMNMGVSQKSKRVTWASDANLFQMRQQFTKAKPPPKSGMRIRAGPHQPDAELPPGFENFPPPNLRRVKPSQNPLTKWRCPPKFEVNSEWKVVSGVESTQVEAENQRHRRVLEAIYPRPSAIPPSPHAPADQRGPIPDDRNTTLVPLTTIEETAAAQPHGSSYSARDIVHALASVLSDCSNHDQLHLLDFNLLLRVLSNPKSLQRLITIHATQQMNLQPTANDTALNTGAPTPKTGAPGPQRCDVSTSMGVRAVNYYKRLVQQHGVGERKDVVPQSCAKSKMMTKPCSFFKSKRGCRNGDSCTYLHDTTLSSQQRVACIVKVPNAKRVKLSK